MKKSITIRIDPKHPIWQEENKTQVILDALELYYATKAVLSGTVKLKTIQLPVANNNEPEDKTNNLLKNKKAVRSFLDAFSKL
ncbi:hypothetical protein [Anaerocellum danielii]|uniref:Uncharacterized protein n=1 Tax=Anaerocellum danielii TaxID=1387557 RepID=A0ABZ0TXN3_9FIRM|nr:hypothetical protein [Caldicellulosiruptor danielii]WPX08213.1 hypothetical protein SOJ16_002080 [Caldicellulosiruptor danielii]